MANTTWNPADKSASIALSNGNLTLVSSSSNQGVRATSGQSSGKYYFEYAFTTVGGYIGLAQATTAFFGTTNAVGVSPGSGWLQVNGSSIINIGGFLSPVALAVDFAAKRIWFKPLPSGNWNGNASYNPATGVGGVDISTITGAPLYPVALMLLSGNGVTANFGASAFSGTVPSGFTAGWDAPAPPATGHYFGVAERWDRGHWDVAHWNGQLGLDAQIAAITLNGIPAGLRTGHILSATTGAITLQGIPVICRSGRGLRAGRGDIMLTGFEIGDRLDWHIPATAPLTPETGMIEVTGNWAELKPFFGTGRLEFGIPRVRVRKW